VENGTSRAGPPAARGAPWRPEPSRGRWPRGRGRVRKRGRGRRPPRPLAPGWAPRAGCWWPF